MKRSALRVASLGRTSMLYDTVRLLVEAGHSIPLLATCKTAAEYSERDDDFEGLAREVGAEFYVGNSLNSPEALARLRAVRADIAVSVNWISVIGADAIAAFPFGILNAHAGALPRYRGNKPISWAIINGELEIGLTIHQMAADDLDSGPIVRQITIPLTEQTYVGDVFREVQARIPGLFLQAVDGLASKEITPRPQVGEPLYGYPRRPEDGLLRWELSADHLARLVRASSEPFAGAYAYLDDGSRITVWRARVAQWSGLAIPGQVVARESGGAVHIATGAGALVLEEVETRALGRMAPALIIRSRRERLGTTPHAPAPAVCGTCGAETSPDGCWNCGAVPESAT